MNAQATSSAIGSICEALETFLKANIPSLEQVLQGFPQNNEELNYPAITIFVKAPKFQALNSYVIFKGPVDPVTKLAEVRRVVGMYDVSFQLDCWSSYRPQRDLLIEQLLSAFSQNPDVPGIDLTLNDYFGETTHLAIDSVKYVDDEAGVQRNESRALVVVLANVRVVTVQSNALIQTIENNLETPPTIDVPTEDDGISII